MVWWFSSDIVGGTELSDGGIHLDGIELNWWDLWDRVLGFGVKGKKECDFESWRLTTLVFQNIDVKGSIATSVFNKIDVNWALITSIS